MAWRQYNDLGQVGSTWAGDTTRCIPDTQSNAYRSATIGRINVVRGVAGLEPVTLDSVFSAQAQRAALMMDAADRLDHHPGREWPCWSSGGAAAAARSNLSVDPGDGDHIASLMDDHGAANEAVGHRRWILYPPTRTMGVGATDTHQALWVISNDLTHRPVSAWVEWPSSGYFPQQMLPHLSRRWSLSADDTATDFSSAAVTVQGPAGSLPVTALTPRSGYGNNTLVWSMPPLPEVVGRSRATYTVAVTGIVMDGRSTSHTYDVHLIDGNWVDVGATDTTHTDDPQRTATGSLFFRVR